jgi:predicted membrane metal-binding protein
VTVNAISFNNGSTWQDAHGQIEVGILGSTLDNPYGPNYGDNVEVQGKLQPPYPHHSPEVLASMAFPRINTTGTTGNPIIAKLFQLRLKLASIIEQSLPQPMAALLIAIVLSLQTPAMKPLIQAFKSTGTAHLIAPSGFKITTIGTLGIVVLTPLFMRAFRPFENIQFAAFIFETIAVTFAAQIASLPIFAFTFNQVSIIAPIANALTVPLLSTLIMLGLVLCMTGAIFPPLGIVCGYIIWPLLWYTNFVIKLCASISWAYLPVSNLDTRFAWSYYGILILILILIQLRWSEKIQKHRSNVAFKPQSSILNFKEAITGINHCGSSSQQTIINYIVKCWASREAFAG